MHTSKKCEPVFFIIGAQKSGTTWLWNMLKQHPGTSLPTKKEIHYFGSLELYAKGDDWYFEHFAGLDSDKIIGEASTSYFYDRVPYWYNKSHQIEFDERLSSLPALIDRKIPNAKYIAILRDPVRRAVSAYSHLMKRASGNDMDNLSPTIGLKEAATKYPKMRILEYGLYAKYIEVWREQIPEDRLRVILFEEQIIRNCDKTLYDIYEYLGLDPNFKPEYPAKPVHKRWGWTRIVFSYYAKKLLKKNVGQSKVAKLMDRFNVLSSFAIKREDIEFLRSIYLPEKEAISAITGHDLSCWDYGEKLLG